MFFCIFFKRFSFCLFDDKYGRSLVFFMYCSIFFVIYGMVLLIIYFSFWWESRVLNVFWMVFFNFIMFCLKIYSYYMYQKQCIFGFIFLSYKYFVDIWYQCKKNIVMNFIFNIDSIFIVIFIYYICKMLIIVEFFKEVFII